MASTSAQTSLSAVSNAGAGTAVDFSTAKKNVTMVVVPSASLVSGVVHLEASQDNTNWVVLRTVDVTGRSNYSVHVTGAAFRYWRANLVRSVSSGTVTATFMEAD